MGWRVLEGIKDERERVGWRVVEEVGGLGVVEQGKWERDRYGMGWMDLDYGIEAS